MDFIELGNGSLTDLADRLPQNEREYILIRDDDSAEAGGSAYWLAEGSDIDAVVKTYEKDGGTASWATVVSVSEKKEGRFEDR